MVLAMANFMAVLDMTIVNVSIPHIAGSLAISANEGTWAITSYAVAEAIMVPLTGWLAAAFRAGTRLHDRRALVSAFLASVRVFHVAAHAGALPAIMQGVMGGPLMPMSQDPVVAHRAAGKRNMALGIWTMTTILGPIAGPLLAGILADSWGWPWSFFVNVPVAILCVGCWPSASSPNSKRQTVKRPIDFVGLALMVTFIGALQIMMDNGENDDWFSSSFIVAWR